MSFPLSVVKDKLSSNSKVLNEHVIKCVVYKDSLNCLDHWIDEITTWAYEASKHRCKSKIKSKVYEGTLFAWFGNDKTDCESNLLGFYSKFVIQLKKYPKFEIDQELISQLLDVYIHLKSSLINMYTTPWTYSKEDYRIKIKEILT